MTKLKIHKAWIAWKEELADQIKCLSNCFWEPWAEAFQECIFLITRKAIIKKKQSAKLKTKWMMVGKKTFAKRIVLEKIAFGYVLIEKGKLFSWGGRKKKEKISKEFAIKTHSFIRKSLRSNLGHQAFFASEEI